MYQQEQLERIMDKMEQAAAIDSTHEIFGARTHQYKRKPVLSEHEVAAFERDKGIALPLPYKQFLTRVGNGGAGPYYGIYSLQKNNAMERLSQPFRLKPEMTDEEWSALTHFEDETDGDEYDEAYDSLFQGMLEIGTQGCTYEMGLVLNGAYAGRVVYFDGDLQKPFFTYEANFLNWYERWLDEIIRGYSHSWFGMTRGGDDAELTALYRQTDELKVRLSALKGMYKLPSVQPETLLFLKEILQSAGPELRNPALELLAKFAEAEAGPFISSLLASGETAGQLAALRVIRYYVADQTAYIEPILRLLPSLTESKAFELAAYLLEQNGLADSTPLLPFFRHDDEKIRRDAIYTVGKMPDKHKHVEHFRECLRDDNAHVVLTALQALRDVSDPRLLPCYDELLEQHEDNDKYILSNLMARLEEFGADALPVLKSAAVHPYKETREKAIALLAQLPNVTGKGLTAAGKVRDASGKVRDTSGKLQDTSSKKRFFFFKGSKKR